jgi:hypothetical protein
LNQKDLSLFVYHYTEGDWDGSGDAVGYNPATKQVEVYDLSHCSCYGPLEDPPCFCCDVEEFDNNALWGSGNSAVDARFLEELKLLGVV